MTSFHLRVLAYNTKRRASECKDYRLSSMPLIGVFEEKQT
jgi:hypothetical protein